MLWFREWGKSLKRGAIAFVGLALCAGALLAGCGGGSSSSTSSASSPTPSEASKEFNDPEGVNGIEPVATFGKEADESERSEASRVLDENLTAREEADFAAQCATLGKQGRETVLGQGKSGGSPSECEAALEKLAKPLSQTKSARVDTLSGEIAALRVKGNKAFALYHGNDGNDYEMPMEKEDGEWKVASLLTLELPPTPVKLPKKAEGKEDKKEG